VIVGNETVKIPNYKNPVSDVFYSVMPSLIFTCIKTTDLICKSPNVTGLIEPFKSYTLKFIGSLQPLGIDYILYEKRSIVSMFPSVMPSVYSAFPIQLNVDKFLNISQGSIVINVGIGLDSIARYSAITQNQIKFGSNSVNTMSPGNYLVGLYYKHPLSLEVQ
jgi:hypothetical protein